MSNATFNSKAFCKILLHAAKYPHCSINGVLLSKTSSLINKEIEFVDAIPLFHVALNLTPMAEIALMQIDEIASKNGYTISGYYTASDNLRDNSLDKACINKVAEKIAALCPTACVVVIDNTKFNLQLDNFTLKVGQYVADGGCKLSIMNRNCFDPANTLDICSYLLERHYYNLLVDFDNHLDDIKLDWMNTELNDIIENCL